MIAEPHLQVITSFNGSFEELVVTVQKSTAQVIVLNAWNTSFSLKNSHISELEAATNASTHFVFLNRVYTEQEQPKTPRTYYVFKDILLEYIHQPYHPADCND